MTGITELAQSLERRAASANEFGEGLFFIKADDVLALVEALEKAQAATTQQGNIASALLDEVTQLRRHADEKAPELRALLIEADSELEVLRQRIAELESRTVKLPAERFCPAEYTGSQLWSETEVWNKAITACADALRADGIKVEAE
ncbi:TPA: hypothetical protein PIU55_002091 [Klebsiella quasipneumoniae subsp. quasipneumoniae]|uniref:hypothetical protein n=1 Tax=Klebsiella pneumoniae TaxID=573 RepID=UPI0028F2DC65|nr:hypothetical protein [Klebsiella pneumoniae]HDH1543473.1 hypothetical protein [Klebsiella quasipneumoniae subsp. quasipneumoniae]HEA8283036.1 hypothetical protein [Klebsiella pneumoniae]